MNPPEANRNSTYVGRFAPSPTGPLHFGSLIAALSSYLDAKANNGIWLVRIEDLDPPREPERASKIILDQLHYLGLEWDGTVMFQSSRIEAYQSALDTLTQKSLTYKCDCTRSSIKAMGSIYNGHCKTREKAPTQNYAIRIKTLNEAIRFKDKIRGYFEQNIGAEIGDFVVLRKDCLFAYQLAVVVDDDHQKVTNIVRGSDLIESTPRQIYLQNLLGLRTPDYAHIPIAVNNQDTKLSKQSFSPGIEAKDGSILIFKSLKFLGQNPPKSLTAAPVREQLQWAVSNWDIHAVPKLANIRETSLTEE